MKKQKATHYRERLFDRALSFTTTSEQAEDLEVESEEERRSVSSLLREAVDQYIPRLRDRRRKRERKS